MLIAAFDSTLAGLNTKRCAIRYRHVAQKRRRRRSRLRHIERHLKLIPRSLGIGQGHRPFDVRVVSRQLRNRLTRSIQSVDSEPRCFALDCTFRVPVKTRRCWQRVRHFRANVEIGQAVANTSDAYGREYGGFDNGCVGGRGHSA